MHEKCEDSTEPSPEGSQTSVEGKLSDLGNRKTHQDMLIQQPLHADMKSSVYIPEEIIVPSQFYLKESQTFDGRFLLLCNILFISAFLILNASNIICILCGYLARPKNTT